jgi:hypothetical protein
MENYRNNTGALRLTHKSSDLLEKACNTVDDCLHIIEDQVTRYLDEKMREMPAFIEKVLFENVSQEKTFHHLMVSDCDVLRFQQKIITILNEKLTAKGFFVELKPQPVEIDIRILHEVIGQNRGVMQASALASVVGGWTAEMIAGLAAEGFFGGEIIENLIGCHFQQAFAKACHAEETACAKRLLLSVTGLLKGIGHQIKEQLSYQAAAEIHGYYDNDIDAGICEECDRIELPA